ncbi:hypothetical protein V2J09_009875 [Rumex salicifolius]
MGIFCRASFALVQARLIKFLPYSSSPNYVWKVNAHIIDTPYTSSNEPASSNNVVFLHERSVVWIHGYCHLDLVVL